MKTARIAFLVFLGLFCILTSPMASEPSFPTKPIVIIVGYAPGAFTDLASRRIAEDARKYLGQEVMISNKPGGGGRVGAELVSKAKPDGYTLGAVTDSSFILLPFLEKVPYKPMDDFTFLNQTGTIDFSTLVLPDSPFKKFKDLIDFARANPDKLTISTVGVGTTNHIAFEALCLLEGLKIKLVPFPGAAAAMTALLGGHVMAASTGASGYVPHVKAKTVRMLAMMSDERLDEYPDVPTLKELGYPLVFQSWHLLYGPKNMDKAVVKKLCDTFARTINSPGFINFAKSLDTWARKPLSGDELREGMIQRSKKNEELFKKLGMGIK